MPRRGENIRKRKDGRWEGRYIKGRKEDGSAVYGFVYGKSYAEAREKQHIAREKAKTEAACGKVSWKTFRNVSEEWLREGAAGWKESTLRAYEVRLERHILPVFGDRLICTITNDDVRRFFVSVQKGEGGRKVSPGSAASFSLFSSR